MSLIVTVTFLKITYFKQSDKNCICGSKLSGQKLISWVADDSNYMDKVKEIKNTIPNTRFNDVVFTCISASIYNYFVKKNSDIPKKISCLLPILLSLSSKSRLVLKNDFTFGPLDLPIVDSSDLLGELERVKLGLAKMKKSHDKDVLYWIMNYLSAPLPGPVIKFLLNTSGYTMIVSNVPGISAFKVFRDCDIVNIFTTAPHTNNTGITMSILTYDNKFRIGLFVDKAIIANQEDIQMIVNDILNNIDAIHEACNSVYNHN